MKRIQTILTVIITLASLLLVLIVSLGSAENTSCESLTVSTFNGKRDITVDMAVSYGEGSLTSNDLEDAIEVVVANNSQVDIVDDIEGFNANVLDRLGDDTGIPGLKVESVRVEYWIDGDGPYYVEWPVEETDKLEDELTIIWLCIAGLTCLMIMILCFVVLKRRSLDIIDTDMEEGIGDMEE